MKSWRWSDRFHSPALRATAKRGGVVLLGCITFGCVQRQMSVQTNPPGAVVYLNDREMGRTPFTKEFLWYGNYDVVVRKDGYQTLKTTAQITAPFWQFFPLDAITDFLPLKDQETIAFTLKPEPAVDPQAIAEHGIAMRQELEGSAHTVHHSVIDVHSGTPPAVSQPAAGQPAVTLPATSQTTHQPD